jgi:transcriptional regulator PpsR
VHEVIQLDNGASTPLASLASGSSPESLARVIEAAADLALLVDRDAIIRDVYVGSAFAGESATGLIGRPWGTTVTRENREKVVQLVHEAGQPGQPGQGRSRQVNQSFDSGRDYPVSFIAVPVGEKGQVLAIGRDLQALSALQQRLVEAQQAMERDYWKLRQIETRYRLLFQRSTEAVLVVDSATLKTVDANPSATAALGVGADELLGRDFTSLLDPSEHDAIEAHLSEVRTRGRAPEIRVHVSGRRELWRIGASLVRQDPGSVFLIHLRPVDGMGPGGSGRSSVVMELLQEAPDGFVVVDPHGGVLSANRAFLDIAQLTSEEQVRGQSIGRWLGRPGADLTVLLTTLQTHGVIRLFSTSVRGEFGSMTEVELSAVAAPTAEVPAVGIVVRDVGRRLARGPEGAAQLSRAVEDLTGLVGKVALRQLVGDTVALMERHFVESALELTGDNRTAAAELLGISRQSLYTKMRRFNLSATAGEFGDDEDGRSVP